MHFSEPPYLRRCSVEYSARPGVEDLRQSILRQENSQSGFSLVAAPLPPLNETAFKIIGNDKQLLLGAMMLHTTASVPRPDGYEPESLELFFDLKHDGIGWQQLVFNSDGTSVEYTHLPYPEAHSSTFSLLRPVKWECRSEGFHSALGGAGCRWFFVWLRPRDLFRDSEVIGFNLGRSRSSGEFSTWNFAAGNGAPDATAFGELRRNQSTQMPLKPKVAATDALAPTRDFTLAVTYDPPMCVISSHYTPHRLLDEMAILESWGISRLHWIDYSNWPSFWSRSPWHEGYARSVKECGELLPCAVEQAKANNLEIIADFKIFDLGINSFVIDPKKSGAALELENYHCATIPEIAAHPELTLQSNAAWRQENSKPVSVLRFYSDAPLRDVAASEVQLWTSDDNREYRRYRGKFNFRQGAVTRPHQRWTPAGLKKEKGSAPNWFLELSNLKLAARYAALRISGEEVELSQRGFMLMEVEDSEGQRKLCTVATKSTPGSPTKYSFWKEWPGWSNVTEPLLQRRQWNTRDLGFTLQEMTHMPALLEPTHPHARQLWLRRIAELLNAGVDGVNLRILTHHNGVMNYLLQAFAPVVVERFRNRYNREPEATPDDYELVRRLRGEALTQFIREAKQLVTERGKKLMVQLESGMEVPPHLDIRMQIHFDFKTWLCEKLVDEVSMKFFSSYSRFVHEEVLPLAQQQHIPVHIISRNLNGVLDARAVEVLPKLVQDARQFGFSGYNFYETANLLEMNPEGVSLPKGLAVQAFTEIRRNFS